MPPLSTPMLAPLRCPTCAGPLQPPDTHARTMTCPYCGASVLLSDRAGTAAPRPPDAPPISRGNRGLVLALAGVGLLMLGGVFVSSLLGPDTAPTVPPPAPPLSLSLNLDESAPPAEPTSPFGRTTLTFGREGTGAGRFEDARTVAVDGDGRIYVGEYSGGRVQVFDSTGAFQTQWLADPEMPLLDLAATHDGTVYAVQGSAVRRYVGATGERLADLPRRGASLSDLTLALDGSLYATNDDGQIVHLSPGGRVLQTIDARAALGERADPVRVAVAGTGDVYALDRWTAEVYHFDPGGRFVDRFGGGGDAPGIPGALGAPTDLVVDGSGRVLVSDMGAGIRVFDAAGRALGALADGVVFGVALDRDDGLYATFRNEHEVRRYRLAP